MGGKWVSKQKEGDSKLNGQCEREKISIPLLISGGKDILYEESSRVSRLERPDI